LFSDGRFCKKFNKCLIIFKTYCEGGDGRGC